MDQLVVAGAEVVEYSCEAVSAENCSSGYSSAEQGRYSSSLEDQVGHLDQEDQVFQSSSFAKEVRCCSSSEEVRWGVRYSSFVVAGCSSFVVVVVSVVAVCSRGC